MHLRLKPLLSLLAACVVAATACAQTPPKQSTPIDRSIDILPENITLGHYFETHPGANGIPVRATLPYKPGGPPERRVSEHFPDLVLVEACQGLITISAESEHTNILGGDLWTETSSQITGPFNCA